MAQIDVLKAQIVRPDAHTPWGFRLQGGADQGQPLKITRITPGSPAARIGLKSGDEVTEIGDTSTQGLTYDAAVNTIAQYGQTLILTVERRARGAIPSNPVMNPNQPPPLKSYHTYDMSGAHPAPRHPPQPQFNVEFQTAQSRPFEEPPRPYNVPHQPQPAPLVPDHQEYTPAQPHYQPAAGMQAYIPPHPTQRIHEEDLLDNNAAQSKTFKILQSLMENEEPYAGTSALPPPRSVHGERWKDEQMEKRRPQAPSGPRVKVFMPQQYNSPLGMYSAQNVVETFQNQAEMQMQEMESQHQDPVSGAQRAVFEEEFGGAT